ncbi:hypothetical protein KO481_20300 [Nocardia sp. NEAU-G5]|uniref:TetR family transcriptional regulator n=1 Tax=Nocardia albiluteola TaxID=2842303 RepID=A0ABS6B141_9NOCA|nr:hypothetical protein [Nocardia albiluteola]MBU3063863.1 hypothetical protein [Nocardia albiluteola]
MLITASISAWFGSWSSESIELAADGKARADPADLVDDLLGYLRAAIRRA